MQCTSSAECLEWEGYRNKDGYGWRRFDGGSHLAHRVAFYQHHGYWPTVCRHTCDNPACVNVEHLLDGTQADNLKDMRERGRFVPRSVLNPDMPEDPNAYMRERRSRQKSGTWNQRPRKDQD